MIYTVWLLLSGLTINIEHQHSEAIQLSNYPKIQKSKNPKIQNKEFLLTNNLAAWQYVVVVVLRTT